MSQNIDTLEIQYEKQIYINDIYSISLEDTDEYMREIFPGKRISYSWDIF
jgi:hypothetical protein